MVRSAQAYAMIGGVPLSLVTWLQGLDRPTSPSVHFSIVDAAEIAHDRVDVVEDLARRLMAAKVSRSYLKTYGARLGWPVVARRLTEPKQKVARGDFGEVVATGWLEDFLGLYAPIRKMRAQLNSGQTLPGIDNIVFDVSGQVIKSIHVLESKLRTTDAFLTQVGKDAYNQLTADRAHRTLDLLEFGLEQLHEASSPFADSLCEHISRRIADPKDDDKHEVVLIVEIDVWDEEVLTELADHVTGELPNCRVHVLLVTNLRTLVDAVFDRAGLDLVDAMEDES